MTNRRGPKRTSAKILDLRGSDAERKRKPAGRKAKSGTPVCPKWLSPGAKAEWKRIVPILEEAGRLSTADRATLISYCEATDEFREATEELRRHGRVYWTPNGTAAVNPWAKIRDKADARRRAAMADLGLTLRDRPKDDEGEVDPFEDFLDDEDEDQKKAGKRRAR